MEAALVNGGLSAGLFKTAWERGDHGEAMEHAELLARWASRFFHMRRITENHR